MSQSTVASVHTMETLRPSPSAAGVPGLFPFWTGLKHEGFATCAAGNDGCVGMLRVCRIPGCETLTLGVTCIVHEVQAPRPLPVGRPFPRHLSPVPITALEDDPADPPGSDVAVGPAG